MHHRRSEWKLGTLGFLLLVLAASTGVVGKSPPSEKLSRAGRAENKSNAMASPAALQAVSASEYAGGDMCFACHDIEAAFRKNPHYKSWTDTSLAWSERGCETCHGPGQAHIDGGGDLSQIFSFKTATAQKISDQCLDCHLQQEQQANFLRNEHGLNSVSCTECHSVHTPQVQEGLLAAPEPALCYSCHGEVLSQFNKPFRHKVNEGFMSCSDCHNQHGGFSARQYRNSIGNDMVCYNCHADKQGPFVFEHLPVKVEGCSICHDAHGSVNPRQLKRSEVGFLCLECHSATPGVPGPLQPSFHNMAQPRRWNCTTCHNQIHGSNLSPVFFE